MVRWPNSSTMQAGLHAGAADLAEQHVSSRIAKVYKQDLWGHNTMQEPDSTSGPSPGWQPGGWLASQQGLRTWRRSQQGC